MKTIYKYSLDATGEQVIKMPKGAQVLTVQNQHGCAVLWALVEKTAEIENRTFLVYGTGYEVTKEGKYIGTFQLHQGSLVFHVFEEIK